MDRDNEKVNVMTDMDDISNKEDAMYRLMLATINRLTKQFKYTLIMIVVIIMMSLGTILALMYDNNRFKEEMMQYLSTIEATTETATTQTVDGEGKINNVDGNQYNDSATHNGGN